MGVISNVHAGPRFPTPALNKSSLDWEKNIMKCFKLLKTLQLKIEFAF